MPVSQELKDLLAATDTAIAEHGSILSRLLTDERVTHDAAIESLLESLLTMNVIVSRLSAAIKAVAIQNL